MFIPLTRIDKEKSILLLFHGIRESYSIINVTFDAIYMSYCSQLCESFMIYNIIHGITYRVIEI